MRRHAEGAAAASPGAPPTHVIVLATLDAPAAPSWLRRRSAARADPQGDAGPAWLTRATIIDVGDELDAPAAAAWLREAGEPELEDGVAVLNWALHAHRIAAGDSSLGPLERRQAVAARVGFGTGDEVAEGRWSDVRELPYLATRRSRRRMLAPEGRLAAILTGREQALVAEELALRARGDLSAGRGRHAALQLLVALDAAIAELAADPSAAIVAERIDELRSHRDPVAGAAQTALSAEPSPEQLAAVEAALGRVEAALRARAAGRG